MPFSVWDIGINCFKACYGLKDIRIRTLSTDTKVTLPDDGWFQSIVDRAEQASGILLYIDPSILSNPAAAFGPYWNYIRLLDGSLISLDYRGLQQ